MSTSLLLGWGAYARDKNTSARLCAKKAGGAYARGGAYLRDTTVHIKQDHNITESIIAQYGHEHWTRGKN